MLVRSGFPFNYDADAESLASGLECKDESRAQQSSRDECDINTIVRRFGLTGELPQNVRAPVYADFEGIFDFQSAMNTVRAAEEAFMALPAEVRSRFANDPQKLVEFCSDEANRAEAEKLGLVVPAPSPAPAPAPAPAPGPAPVPAPGG